MENFNSFKLKKFIIADWFEDKKSNFVCFPFWFILGWIAGFSGLYETNHTYAVIFGFFCGFGLWYLKNFKAINFITDILIADFSEPTINTLKQRYDFKISLGLSNYYHYEFEFEDIEELIDVSFDLYYKSKPGDKFYLVKHNDQMIACPCEVCN